MSDDASNIKGLGWRQGSVLPPSLFADISEASGLPFEVGKHCGVILSQDCDVVCPTYADEPMVEVVRASRRSSLDGNLTYAKSARRLHLLVQTSAGVQAFELSAHERFCVERRLLEKAAPDSETSLSEESKRQLVGWIVKRYRRAAFPDEFVRRLKKEPEAKKLRKLFERSGVDVAAVYVLLNSQDDLPDGTSYELDAWVTVPAERYDDKSVLGPLEDDFAPALEAALNAFPGIHLGELMVVSEATFTLDDARKSKRLDLENLTYRFGGETAEQEGA